MIASFRSSRGTAPGVVLWEMRTELLRCKAINPTRDEQWLIHRSSIRRSTTGPINYSNRNRGWERAPIQSTTNSSASGTDPKWDRELNSDSCNISSIPEGKRVRHVQCGRQFGHHANVPQ